MGFHHGLSGLNASSKSLDVIGHNIANSNTTGFKASRAEFNEMVASAMGASSGNNAGIGVSLAAISQQFAQGVITPTSNGLDMAINGEGFFVVKTPGGEAYTRSGNFQLDKSGQLVTVNGENVMGYTIDELGNQTSAIPTEIKFPSDALVPAKQTTKITTALNLDARSLDISVQPPEEPTPRANNGTSLQVYDSLGVPRAVSLYFEKTGANTWDVYDSLDVNATPVLTGLAFNPDGTLDTSINGSSFDLTITTTNGSYSPIGPFDPQQQQPSTLPLTVDLAKVTQFGSSFSVSKLTQDGYTAGELTGVNVSADGTLMATYSNGITRAEARVALAKFTNTQGLQPDGNNNWVSSAASGVATYGAAASGSFGSIMGSALEESNVDLTAQLVNMMTAQRAYQANAQTIKTQDQVFSTLVNLR